MINALMNKAKTMVISLRLSLLAIFVTLFVAAILLLIFFTSLRFEKTLSYTSFALMDEVSDAVLTELTTEIQPAVIQSQFTANLIKENVFDPNNESEIVNYTYHLVQLLPIVQGARWGDYLGNFVIAQKEDNGTISSEIYDRRLIPPIRIVRERNQKGIIIQRFISHDINYDPRLRPWYIKAKAEKHTTWTDIYLFQRHPFLAFTTASPVIKDDGTLQGVFGLDIRLDYLINVVSNQKVSAHGFSFIVTTDGKLIAFPKISGTGRAKNNNLTTLPDIHTISMPWLAKSLEVYNTTHQPKFMLEQDGKSYLFTYKKIPILADHEWLIGAVVPTSDFTAELEKLHQVTLFVSFIMLILGIILISYLVSRIVKPIHAVVNEADKIKHFDLEGDFATQSKIREVINLTEAIRAMKNGLRSFQKYVPKILVRQLIETQENSRVGGVRKTLTVFFSDIENFTALSETMDANELMIHTCEYFEELSRIILERHGTIDKYIGDSIMAFWGAPLVEDQPNHQAARAALYCQRKLNQLNATWKIQGKFAFHTRIGINVGDAIVGNLGSSERFDYTAIGDTVNIASRLEEVNKLYGTKIMVSDAVYQAIKNQFILRMVDWITLKGKMESSYIYELLGEDMHEIPFEVDAYREIFALGFAAYCKKNWDKGISYFKQCLIVYPADTIAPIFIHRCLQFKLNAPPPGWNGIWR